MHASPGDRRGGTGVPRRGHGADLDRARARPRTSDGVALAGSALATGAITGMHPRELLRGLIARRTFSGSSEHLDLIGVGWTRPNPCQIAIDRRSEVAKLD